MRLTHTLTIAAGLALLTFAPQISHAQVFEFNTGSPDGKIATASRPSGSGISEIESADDFLLSAGTRLDGATFTGLLPSTSNVKSVDVEIYRVFPKDSTDPPSGNVPTRVNSPSDVVFVTRGTTDGSLTFTTSTLNASFTASNSVVNGINKIPNSFTGGEGAVTGEEVLFDVNFTNPLLLPKDHYFFVPQVELTTGDFLWLSAPKPIVAPGTPFTPDLQSWIRNDALSPDWLRVGTDITHQGPFNAAFSLRGEVAVAAVPEPSSLVPLGLGSLLLLILVGTTRRSCLRRSHEG